MEERRNQPINTYQPDYSDEISLVDLAATFIRRRRVFYAVFLLCTLGGLAYALLTPEKFDYVSLVQLAEKDSKTLIQTPETVIATLEARWLPEQQVLYYAENESKLPFGVSFQNTKDTALIRFTTGTTARQKQLVEKVHAALIDKLSQHQEKLVKSEQASINRQIESLNAVIASMMAQASGDGTALPTAIQEKSELESALQSLGNLEVIVSARQSIQETGPKRSLIVALAVVLGLMLGIFAAFMAEFGASLKKQLAVTDGR
ncbi:lipopolysaccharide biosynthesis protein [Marinobacter psychrophilus]|uniref:Lipopolysaccharide biosynthesis protein n=1 Tax=Marinobacter psychrophilus TaxID=330734 RepID=A0A0H4I5J6_9GAMM|nr:Wzz/FepE/Etk N-terminal domain-containing protein [Marinobacter psychrophilus]AKO53003.1 lipopolysaccharide biosynthesis protein [Marinobacter psychrophilus]